MPKFRVFWDNGHAIGDLPGIYDSIEEADLAGKEWFDGMVSFDPDPEGAQDTYTWDVAEVDDAGNAITHDSEN